MRISLKKAENLKSRLVNSRMEAINKLTFHMLADKKIIHMKSDAVAGLEDIVDEKAGYLKDKCSMEEYMAFIEDIMKEEEILNTLIEQVNSSFCDDRCYAVIHKSDGNQQLKNVLYQILKKEHCEEHMETETGYLINTDGEQVSFKYQKKIVETLDYDRELLKNKVNELEEKIEKYDTLKESKYLEESIEYIPKYIYENVYDNLSVFLENNKESMTRIGEK